MIQWLVWKMRVIFDIMLHALLTVGKTQGLPFGPQYIPINRFILAGLASRADATIDSCSGSSFGVEGSLSHAKDIFK